MKCFLCKRKFSKVWPYATVRADRKKICPVCLLLIGDIDVSTATLANIDKAITEKMKEMFHRGQMNLEKLFNKLSKEKSEENIDEQ